MGERDGRGPANKDALSKVKCPGSSSGNGPCEICARLELTCSFGQADGSPWSSGASAVDCPTTSRPQVQFDPPTTDPQRCRPGRPIKTLPEPHRGWHGEEESPEGLQAMPLAEDEMLRRRAPVQSMRGCWPAMRVHGGQEEIFEPAHSAFVSVTSAGSPIASTVGRGAADSSTMYQGALFSVRVPGGRAKPHGSAFCRFGDPAVKVEHVRRKQRPSLEHDPPGQLFPDCGNFHSGSRVSESSTLTRARKNLCVCARGWVGANERQNGS